MPPPLSKSQNQSVSRKISCILISVDIYSSTYCGISHLSVDDYEECQRRIGYTLHRRKSTIFLLQDEDNCPIKIVQISVVSPSCQLYLKDCSKHLGGSPKSGAPVFGGENLAPKSWRQLMQASGTQSGN